MSSFCVDVSIFVLVLYWLMNRVLFSSASPHWATPKGVYDQLNEEFQFDFDPCPLGGGDFDGTKSSWEGRRVFCNPPYNRGISQFLQKATEADVSVFLLPARTDTKWFHDIVLKNSSEIRFIKGRLKFGDSKNSAPFPSVIVIFRRFK